MGIGALIIGNKPFLIAAVNADSLKNLLHFLIGNRELDPFTD